MSADYSTIRLDQLGPIVTGKTPSNSVENAYSINGTPFITPKDMDGRKWIDATERYLSLSGLDAVKKSLVPRNSVAVSCIGSDMGKAVMVERDSVTNQQINTIIVNSEKWNPEYIYYLLATKQQLLKDIAGGSATPILNKGHFGKVEIDVPSKEIQDKVAKILSALDEKIRLNTQTNQTLEQIAQAIFKSWFVDFDPVKAKIAVLEAGGTAEQAELAAMSAISAISAKDETALKQLQAEQPEAYAELAQTAALFPSKMVDSELGEIPEGWKVKQLVKICNVINGRAYKNTEFKTEGTPIVRIQNLSNGGKTVYSDLELPPEKYIEGEDFIYAWSATFGPYIWRGPKSIYHYHIWKMEVDESVTSRYFLYLSMFRKTEAMKNAGTGSIFTHLTKKIMESQQILIGCDAINKKVSDILNPLFQKISALTLESKKLADIRDSLLPELLSGRAMTKEDH